MIAGYHQATYWLEGREVSVVLIGGVAKPDAISVRLDAAGRGYLSIHGSADEVQYLANELNAFLDEYWEAKEALNADHK